MVRDPPTEWPDLEQYAQVPLFNTKAVVQKTGIAAPTLRAWERRYRILSPHRAHNAYRLYSERDIALLGWLKERVDAGMSISQAIALFRHLEEEQQHLQHKDLPPERTAPSQVMLSPPAVEKHETSARGDEQEPDATSHLPLAQERLLAAFSRLDEALANRLLASMVALYSIEQVCTALITPTLWEIGRRWEQGLLTVSSEHFASAFFHGWLTNLLHAMPTNPTAPLVLVGCAPGELHELAPLMIALLLRRAGLRVVYLGQSMETASLVQTVRQVSPALLCVSVTRISSLEAVTELGQRLQQLPTPRPVLIFGGQAFEQRPELSARVPGVSLQGDLHTSITQLRRMAWQQVEDKQ